MTVPPPFSFNGDIGMTLTRFQLPLGAPVNECDTFEPTESNHDLFVEPDGICAM